MPELVGQDLSGSLVGAQRLGLSPFSVVGQHQESPEALPPGMLSQQGLQFPDRPGLGAARQQPLDPDFLSLEAKLIESCRLGQERGLVGEVGEGRPAPQGQGVVERADRDARIDGEGLLRVSHELVEARGIQLGGIEPQAVAGCMALDPVAAEGLPQVRDVGLDDVPSPSRAARRPRSRRPGSRRARARWRGRADARGPRAASARRGGWDRPPRRPRAARGRGTASCPVHGTRRPRGYERSDLFRHVAPLRSDREDTDGIRESLEVQLAAIQVPNALDRAGEVNEVLTREDLARTGLGAEPGREVQRPAAVPALDRHRLTGVQADPHGEREIRGGPGCLQKARLQVDRRPDGLTWGTEHREGFVSPQLDHGSVPSLDMLSSDLGERCREAGSRLVAPLLGEHGVSTDVRDQEDPDLLGRLVRRRAAFRVAATHPGRSRGSLTDLPHVAEYRPSGPRSPCPLVVLSVGHGRDPGARRLRTAGRRAPAVLKSHPRSSHHGPDESSR